MKVFLSMAASVLIWSLYPLAATIGLKTMTSAQMIMVVYFFSGFGALILAAHYLWIGKKFSSAMTIAKTLPSNAYLTILVSGIAGVLCHASFIIALGMANKGGVSLIYESWPIIAVVATPFMMRKEWKEVNLREFIVSLIALAGVAIIILSDKEVSFGSENTPSEETDFFSLAGYILAFAGAYLCAIHVVTKGVFSEYFKGIHDDFGTTFISEAVSRMLSLIFMLGGFALFSQHMSFVDINWIPAFFIGFVVFVVGGALYTYSLLNATSPTVHILYYFVPVFAVVWLWAGRETEVNAGLFIGGAIVLACNIYLFYASRKAAFTENH